MELIQEIRSLRNRLEESIKTNEKLRRQLERQGSEFDQGKEGPSQRALQACKCFLSDAFAWIIVLCVPERAFNLGPKRLQFKSWLGCLSAGYHLILLTLTYSNLSIKW